MSQTLPEGALVKVEMTVRIPTEATYEQVDEWVQHEVGGCGGVSLDNPLMPHEPEDWRGDVELTELNKIGTKERTLIDERPDGFKRYSVKYSTENY